MAGSISFVYKGCLARSINDEGGWTTYIYKGRVGGQYKPFYSLSWFDEFDSMKLKNVIDTLLNLVPECQNLMIYQDIIAGSFYENGGWITNFYFGGDYITEVRWTRGYTEESIKAHIDKSIVPFVYSDFEVFRPAVTDLVKTASKQYEDIPDYEQKVSKHVDNVLNLFSDMKNWTDKREKTNE